MCGACRPGHPPVLGSGSRKPECQGTASPPCTSAATVPGWPWMRKDRTQLSEAKVTSCEIQPHLQAAHSQQVVQC